MSDVTLSFLNRTPPLAARIWSAADASVRRNFILSGGGGIEAQDNKVLNDALFGEVVLPSGELLRGVIGKDDHPADFLRALLDGFVRTRGVPAMYGLKPTYRTEDLEAMFIPADAAGAFSAKPVVVDADGGVAGFRVETKQAKLKVVLEEEGAYASAVTAPMLDAPHHTAALDLIPVERAGGGVAVEVVHSPGLAASFFRYLEIDANDAAAVIGRKIFDRVIQASTGLDRSGGELFAAAIHAIRFGQEGEALRLGKRIEAFVDAPLYAGQRKDLALAVNLLRFAGGAVAEEFPSGTLDLFGADDLPASTWLVIYANRFLTDFAIDTGQQNQWREQLVRLSRWTSRLELRRSFPSYAHGAPAGPGEVAADNISERREQIAAAKKKSNTGL